MFGGLGTAPNSQGCTHLHPVPPRPLNPQDPEPQTRKHAPPSNPACVSNSRSHQPPTADRRPRLQNHNRTLPGPRPRVPPQPVGRGARLQGGAGRDPDHALHGGGGDALRPAGDIRGRRARVHRQPQGDHQQVGAGAAGWCALGPTLSGRVGRDGGEHRQPQGDHRQVGGGDGSGVVGVVRCRAFENPPWGCWVGFGASASQRGSPAGAGGGLSVVVCKGGRRFAFL